MTLIRKPFAVNSIFDDLFDHAIVRNDSWKGGSSFPAINIIKSEVGFELELAAPGMKKSDFNIEIKEGILMISSESKSEREEKKLELNYTRKEFSYNSFSRSFTLPKEVDEEKIEAKYEEGILKIRIPNSEAKIQKSKQIEIG
ncbi:MAG: Hsp20/alpha crystallin family protein [Salibacteraceae bacterium]|nr:Hsp20/alpha crystallin family protein [Salibacteraceae bacterium]|tara:strand:- start:9915 stop:10343 length:429 start_codon:yes stop_codon:yes gene_type:complete